MGGCFVSHCFWYMSFVIRMYLALLGLSEIVPCLVLPDEHRKRNKSKVHIFTFTSQVKNMHDLKQVKSHT